MSKLILKGTITALVTPFKQDGSVDIGALKRLVEFQLDGEIDGIVPCGSTGEAATMTLEEHELVVKTVVQEVAGKVPVIAGAGSNDTQKAIALSEICQRAGADALLHVTPFYNKPTPSGLIAHFKALASKTKLPMILYNVPGRTGSNVSPHTIIKIANDVPQVIGVKEASGSLPQMMEIVKGAPKDFAVLSGDDVLTLPLMAVGGVGIISVVSNEVPRDFSEMTRAALNGDFEKAKALHYKLLDLMNINFIESNPIPVKTALSMMGLIEENFRLPLTPLEEKNREPLKKVLEDLKLI